MPAAVVLATPEVDLTESGDSFQTNLGVDSILGSLMPVNELYAAGHDLAHPYLSPLFADLTGFPPTILTTGTRDLFLSNTVRMHRALRRAGIHGRAARPRGGCPTAGSSAWRLRTPRSPQRSAASSTSSARKGSGRKHPDMFAIERCASIIPCC